MKNTDLGQFRFFLFERGISKKTIGGYISIIQRLEKWEENYVREFLVKHSEKFLSSTINKYISGIKAYGEFKNSEWTKKLKRRREKITPKPLLTNEELSRFLSSNDLSIASDEYFVLFNLLSATGMRIGEACALTTDDIDFDNYTIHIKPAKTNEGRVVLLEDFVREMLKDYVMMIDRKNLFIKTHTSYRLWFKERLREIQIAEHRVLKMSPNCLRHQYISRNLNKSDLLTVQHIVGHTDPKTTARYRKVDTEAQKQVLKNDPLNQASLEDRQIIENIKDEFRKYQKAYGGRLGFKISEDDSSLFVKVSLKNEK